MPQATPATIDTHRIGTDGLAERARRSGQRSESGLRMDVGRLRLPSLTLDAGHSIALGLADARVPIPRPRSAIRDPRY